MAASAASENRGCYRPPATYPQTPMYYMKQDDCAVRFEMDRFLQDKGRGDVLKHDSYRELHDYLNGFSSTFEKNIYYGDMPVHLEGMETLANTSYDVDTDLVCVGNEDLKVLIDLMWRHFGELNKYFFL